MKKIIINKRYIYYTILLFISIVVITLSLWQEYKANSLFNKYRPIAAEISKSEKNLVLAHLWLEELLEGDKSIIYKDLMVQFESSKLKENLPLKSDLKEQINNINKKIEKLIEFSRKRYEKKDYSGSKDDQNYDKEFNKILDEFEELKLFLHIKREKDINTLNKQSVALFILYISSLSMFFFIIFLIEKNLRHTLNENKKKDILLLEQSKLASLGEMIGNIAHQWRQPLSVMTTGASGLKIKHEYNQLDDKFLIEVCDIIVENGEYLSQTIDDFRNYIKKDPKKKRFDITNTVKNSIKLLRGNFSNHNISIIKNIKKKEIKVKGVENELLQALINILTNSKDALVENNEIEERFIFVDMEQRCSKKEPCYLLLEIYDNAGGIRPDIIEKIFEPYFTTKHTSVGTGLGLYMTYNIIVGHFKGSIYAQNYKFKYEDKQYLGAKFLIKLPIPKQN